MGIGALTQVRAALLQAFGENKADALAGVVESPITASNSSSILQMHPTAKIQLYGKLASNIAKLDYYRWKFDDKPNGQATLGARHSQLAARSFLS